MSIVLCDKKWAHEVADVLSKHGFSSQSYSCLENNDDNSHDLSAFQMF